MPTSPMAVHPKDQPAGNDDRSQDKNRKGETAIRKKRIEKLAEHVGRSLGSLFPYENAMIWDSIAKRYPVFKGPATLYVVKMMPDGNDFVLTSSNERGGVPSAKKRFPVPSSTG